MQQHEQTFDELSTRIVVVTFEQELFVRAYIEETGTRWPILIDRDRTLYGGYGMHRGGVWNIWGPRTWVAYAKEFARGKRPGPAHDDTMQLGGDVLIDPSGLVRLHHVGAGPADRPSIDTILAARRQQPRRPPEPQRFERG